MKLILILTDRFIDDNNKQIDNVSCSPVVELSLPVEALYEGKGQESATLLLSGLSAAADQLTADTLTSLLFAGFPPLGTPLPFPADSSGMSSLCSGSDISSHSNLPKLLSQSPFNEVQTWSPRRTVRVSAGQKSKLLLLLLSFL